jgi:hypothetical protein
MKQTISNPMVLICLVLFITACAQTTAPPIAEANIQPTPTTTFTPLPTETRTSEPSPTATLTETPVPSATVTQTPLPTETLTPTPTAVPTYVVMRGKVIIEQAVCHYGPGAPYLYKYGVYKGSNLEILRRIEYGNYVEVQAIGGNNRCWVRADYFELKGEYLDLEPVSAADVPLPITPYYASPGGVSAVRRGDEVTVSWNPLHLRAGDDSGQVPYIVEAWVCQDGEYRFRPTGSWTTSVTIIDEPGCEQPSQAFFTAAEKHGYTRRITVRWPEHP